MKFSVSILVHFLLLYFSSACFGQNPGGVTGSTLWLKANAGTNTTVNNASVNSWASQAASPAVTVTQGTAALQPTYRIGAGTGTNNTSNRFNYNPFIYTDGTSNRLVATGNINLGTTSTGMTAFQVIGQDIGIVSMEWNNSVNGNVKLKGDGNLYINGTTGSEGTTNLNRAVCPTTQEACIGLIAGQPTNVNGRYNGQTAVIDVGWSVGTATGISIGSNVDNGEFMNGGMGEYITFSTTLSAADIARVQSYLAVKYAITLGTSAAPVNYVSSASTTIWSGLAAYHNKILGIGRDDNSGLLQKQSHQYDDTVRIYKGTLATTNGLNSSTFAQNGSFVMVGSTTGKLCSTAAAISEMPTGLTSCNLYSRLEREWRVVRTNMAEIFNMDVKLASCGAPASVNVADLRLLVDDDGNFSNGGTTCYYNGDGTGLVFSYTNPTITLTGISTTHIPNNATRFITMASINPLTPLPVELLFFDAKLNEYGRSVDLSWATQTEINSDYFDVQRRTDDNSWETLDRVDVAGNSINVEQYYAVDEHPVFGINYYRLKQVDQNGEVNFSETRAVALQATDDIMLFPNPANNSLTVMSDKLRFSRVTIVDQTGRVVPYTACFSSDNSMRIDTQNMSNGFYYLQAGSDVNQLIHKFVVSH